jgi:hypothetical protein
MIFGEFFHLLNTTEVFLDHCQAHCHLEVLWKWQTQNQGLGKSKARISDSDEDEPQEPQGTVFVKQTPEAGEGSGEEGDEMEIGEPERDVSGSSEL